MQQQQTISRLDCDMWQKVDSIQLVMTSSVARLRSSKAFPKANLHQRKGDGHCLVVCCWSDPLQLSESWQNHYIWEIHSANQWDALKAATPGARLVNRKGPILLEDNTQWHGAQPALKNWTNWATKFCLICHIPWPLANWLPFLQASQQLFVRKMFPQSAGGRKCFPRVCWILKHGFLCYRNKQTYFSLARTYWL